MTWRPYRPPSVETDTTRLKTSMEAVAKRLGTSSPDVITAVFDDWAELVGADLTLITEPESLVNKVLVVSVLDSVWMSRLKWMAPKIAQAVNQMVGEGTVERVELRIRRTSAPK